MLSFILLLSLAVGFISTADKSAPTLFRNDTKYTISEYPPEMVKGEVYVPLRFFVGLSGIQYVYSPETPGFYLRNEETGRFISFSFNTTGIVVDSEFVTMVFPILNNTVYLPLEYSADILSLKIEKIGSEKLRLSDGSEKLTFEEVVKIYEESENPDNPSVILPNDPTIPSDTPKKLRNLYITVCASEGDNTEKILDIFKKYSKKGTFLFSEESIRKNPFTVLRAFVEGHGIGISYADAEEVEKAQRSLYSILNYHTRIIGICDCKEAVDTSHLSEMGYLVNEKKSEDTEGEKPSVTAREIYNKTFKKNTVSVTFGANDTDAEVIEKILNYTSDDNGIGVLPIDTTTEKIFGGN